MKRIRTELRATLTFDDPAVADEAILPSYTYPEQAAERSNAIENRFNWSFARLLTPTLRSHLIAAGYTKAGRSAAHRASIPPILASNTELTATIRMKRWSRWDSPGALRRMSFGVQF